MMDISFPGCVYILQMDLKDLSPMIGPRVVVLEAEIFSPGNYESHRFLS